jgi:hypothetical protein
VAGLLSSVLPGLGQFYNRQLGQGAGFLSCFLVLAGLLIGGVDLKDLDQALASGTIPDGLWKLLVLELLLLGVITWSITDAARTAKKS